MINKERTNRKGAIPQTSKGNGNYEIAKRKRKSRKLFTIRRGAHLPEGDESKKAIEGSHSYIENEKVKGKASGVGGE